LNFKIAKCGIYSRDRIKKVVTSSNGPVDVRDISVFITVESV